MTNCGRQGGAEKVQETRGELEGGRLINTRPECSTHRCGYAKRGKHGEGGEAPSH